MPLRVEWKKCMHRKTMVFLSLLGFVLLLISVGPLVGHEARFAVSEELTGKRLLDRSGQLLNQGGNWRQERAVSLEKGDMSETLLYAFLLAEDRRFFSHSGVDVRALARALWQTLKERRFVSGASTISMQLARIHWPHLGEKRNKIAQMLQALRLERNYSKAELLQIYLDTLPFAYQVAGVVQACQTFFQTPCKNLSLAQEASLALIPRNPKRFTQDRVAMKRSRNRLLQQLGRTLDIERSVLYHALEEPLSLTMVRHQPFAHHFLNRVENESSERIIRTTLDSYLHKNIEDYLRMYIDQAAGDTAAVLVVDNATGGVLAYVGSPDFFHPEHGQMDNIMALRSPGSVLKPFVYALALERGWRLSLPLADLPMNLPVGLGSYFPQNFSGRFSGPVSFREALGNSKNIPALRLTQDLGVSLVLKFLRQVGFGNLNQPADFYGLGLTLGNGEVSLWELVSAYRMLALGGVLSPLRLTQGSVSPGVRVLSEESSYLITDVLQDPQARAAEFGRYGPLEFTSRVAVKTGTSGAFRDHWVLGYNYDYTVGVWTGNSSGRPLRQQTSAARGAGSLFRDIFHLLDREGNTSSVPETITARMVCTLSGEKPGEHCPHVRRELFHRNNQPEKTCGFHKSKEIKDCSGRPVQISYVDFPEDYAHWKRSKEFPSLATKIAQLSQSGGSDCNLSRNEFASLRAKIIYPVTDSIYALDPTIPTSHQNLRLRLSQMGPGLKVFANEELIENTDLAFFWPMQAGQTVFELRQGEEVLDRIRIQVH